MQPQALTSIEMCCTSGSVMCSLSLALHTCFYNGHIDFLFLFGLAKGGSLATFGHSAVAQLQGSMMPGALQKEAC